MLLSTGAVLPDREDFAARKVIREADRFLDWLDNLEDGIDFGRYMRALEASTEDDVREAIRAAVSDPNPEVTE